MTSLREAKKRATRQALADAAARLVVQRDSEVLTVANIAHSAGVSPRTFHNYFSSASDALLHFCAGVLTNFTEQLPTIYPGATVNEFFISLMLDVLGDKEKELHSLPTLFFIREMIENLNHSEEERKKYESVGRAILEAFLQREPDLDELDLSVILNAHAGACAIIMEQVDSHLEAGTPLGADAQKELVNRVFAALRRIS